MVPAVGPGDRRRAREAREGGPRATARPGPAWAGPVSSAGVAIDAGAALRAGARPRPRRPRGDPAVGAPRRGNGRTDLARPGLRALPGDGRGRPPRPPVPRRRASSSGARTRPRPSRTSRPRRPASRTWSGSRARTCLLAKLYRGGGEIEKAIAELEGYAAVAGEDYGVRKELKAWYRDRGDHEAVVGTLWRNGGDLALRCRPGQAAGPGAPPGLRGRAARAGPRRTRRSASSRCRSRSSGCCRRTSVWRRRPSTRTCRLGEMYLDQGPSARRARAGDRGPSSLPRRREGAYAEGHGRRRQRATGERTPIEPSRRRSARSSCARSGGTAIGCGSATPRCSTSTSDAVTFAVPTEVHRTWIEYTYGDELRRAVDAGARRRAWGCVSRSAACRD